MAIKGSSKYNLDIEVIIPMIIDGDNYRTIAQKLGVPKTTLWDFLNRPDHSARVMSALNLSANAIAEKAEQALLDAPASLVEMTRARELAQHYRWLSAKRNPKQFSDKYIQEIDMTTTNKVIKVIVPDEDSDTSNDEDVNQ